MIPCSSEALSVVPRGHHSVVICVVRSQIGCGEGGCGACTVVLGTYDARSHQVSWAPINSCLRLLATLDGAAIVTVEGMREDGRACVNFSASMA